MKSYIISILVIIVALTSCSKKEHDPIYHTVSDITLTDVGQQEEKFDFNIKPLENNTLECTIRTRAIKKDDIISNIEAYTIDNYLYIDITSYPNTFPWEDESLTTHDITFKTTGFIPNVTYYVTTSINNQLNKVEFKIED